MGEGGLERLDGGAIRALLGAEDLGGAVGAEQRAGDIGRDDDLHPFESRGALPVDRRKLLPGAHRGGH
ncbi:MAG: hypothetical protein U5Q44_14305 [Dehalococcoidia bacterium]|nr:hypothetical protein [Dehalococcoidia bacterium]